MTFTFNTIDLFVIEECDHVREEDVVGARPPEEGRQPRHGVLHQHLLDGVDAVGEHDLHELPDGVVQGAQLGLVSGELRRSFRNAVGNFQNSSFIFVISNFHNE